MKIILDGKEINIKGDFKVIEIDSGTCEVTKETPEYVKLDSNMVRLLEKLEESLPNEVKVILRHRETKEERIATSFDYGTHYDVLTSELGVDWTTWYNHSDFEINYEYYNEITKGLK